MFPSVFLNIWGPQHIPLDVIEPVSSIKWNLVFFGNTQLASKEWEIENSDAIPIDNLDWTLYIEWNLQLPPDEAK